MHRTKCTAIIKNFVSASLKEELKNDLQGKKFVLLVDESTDIGTQKHLCILVRFYCDKKDKIRTEFLSLAPVIEASAQILFEKIAEEIAAFGQTLSNCIGFASNGASCTVGNNNAVWSRIKNESPNCVQMKCICHYLSLCIEHAFSKLPSDVGYILTKVPFWFANSVIKREDYKALFKVINSADEENNHERNFPLPFQKLPKTRWLIRGKILYNILVNWKELLAYFSSCETKLSLHARYKCSLIKEMLADRINYLYFTFITPIIQEFKKIYFLFQQINGDPYELSKELLLHQESLHRRLCDQNESCKSLKCVDFGAKFNQEVSIHLAKFINGPIHEEKQKIEDIK